MSESLSCYRCGHSLKEMPLPLGRRDECPNCIAELHVCHMCLMYDDREPNKCKEEDALEVVEKSRANFCEYFKPNPIAYTPGFVEAQNKAFTELDALFRNESTSSKKQALLDSSSESPENENLSRAEDLFK